MGDITLNHDFDSPRLLPYYPEPPPISPTYLVAHQIIHHAYIIFYPHTRTASAISMPGVTVRYHPSPCQRTIAHQEGSCELALVARRAHPRCKSSPSRISRPSCKPSHDPNQPWDHESPPTAAGGSLPMARPPSDDGHPPTRHELSPPPMHDPYNDVFN